MATEPNKLAELRAAIAALQDDHIEYEYRAPWYVHHLDSTSIVSCRNCDVAEADDPVVANYIAAADPQTVLALVDQVERLRRDLNAAVQIRDAEIRCLKAENGDLRERNAMLEKSMAKVVAHTAYLRGASSDLLTGLLDSCRRIAEQALAAAKPADTGAGGA